MKKEYSEWFKEVMMEFYIRNNIDSSGFNEFNKNNTLFITLNYNSRKVHATRNAGVDYNPEFYNLDRLYNVICRKLIGRHYNRSVNHSRLPMCIAAMDANGTKYAASFPGQIVNKHIHSIWMTTPDTNKNFRDIIYDPFFIEELKEKQDFRDIDIQSFSGENSNGNDVDRMTGYAAKFMRLNEKQLFTTDEIRIYPSKLYGNKNVIT